MSEQSKLEYAIMASFLIPAIWIFSSLAMHEKTKLIDSNKNGIYDLNDLITFNKGRTTYKINELGPKYQLWLYEKALHK